MSDTAAPAASSHELVLDRLLEAAPETLFRCWTDPALMKQWFVPKPWTIAEVKTDVRPGGASLIVMRSPEGQEFPNRGVYLEVVPGRKIVFTDAYTEAWVPAEKPFFTAIVTFDPEGGPGELKKTRYRAVARHWTAADKEAHEKMGFHEGWGQCATQLEELAKTL